MRGMSGTPEGGLARAIVHREGGLDAAQIQIHVPAVPI